MLIFMHSPQNEKKKTGYSHPEYVRWQSQIAYASNDLFPSSVHDTHTPKNTDLI